MPRVSRAIAVGYPHHITQRGNYRQTVFAEESDYARYLELLAGFAPKYGLDIWAYCLMPNHIHMVGVPGRQESLAKTFNTVHMLYAQYFNRKRNATGHLWQGRFFSCVLDEWHLYAAVRYLIRDRAPINSDLIGALSLITRIHGMAPYKDIDIQFTGLRPGEKLFEEILTAEEGTDASRHEKIFIARNDAKFTLPELPAILDEFNAIISDPSPESNDQMKSLLRKYVKYYTHDTAMSTEC